MGQRGQLDRIPLAHSGPILALDWTHSATSASLPNTRDSSGPIGLPRGSNWYSNVGAGLFDDLAGNALPTSEAEGPNSGAGWLASGGLDRCVKVQFIICC
jgi:WD repeat-containing protein 24